MHSIHFERQGIVMQNRFQFVLKACGFLAALLIFNIEGTSQIIYNGQGHIPHLYQTDWSVAGLLPNTSATANYLFDVTQEPGASWDDKVNSALNKARTASGTSIIYFPALPGGQTYMLGQPIVLTANNGNNIIFQGDGAGATILEFSMAANNNCFDVRGQGLAPNANLVTDLLKRQKTFTVDNAIDFEAEDWIHLEQPYFDYAQTTSWRASIGQITQIESKVDNIITIRDEANKNYLPASGSLPDQATQIKMIRAIQNVGIENLKIKRLGGNYSSSSDLGYNVYFQYAANCWVKGVEMDMTAKNHIEINRSSHIEVSGCYIHHSIYYGSGGYGYGVYIEMSSTNCLIENNVFQHLRHSLNVANGANANVFSYNYSREQYWTALLPGSDLVLHGGYAFSNLFEQNIVERIEADVSYTTPPFWGFHGYNGPYNAFVRNASFEGSPTNVTDFHDLVLKNANSTSVIGCLTSDISTSGITSLATNLFGREVLQNQTYENGTNLNHPASSFELLQMLSNFYIYLADVSYYYSSRPDFLGANYSFPTLGPGNPPVSNFPYIWSTPASDRWFNSSVRYAMAEPTVYVGGILNGDITLKGIVYITTDITIPVGRTLTIEPGTLVRFADQDTINLTVDGSLVIGSNAQFQTGENGNTKVVLTGSQTLIIPPGVSFQVRANSGLTLVMDVDVDAATFIAEANASITGSGGGRVVNSIFIKDPTSTVQFQHGSTDLTITNSEFRYP